MAERGVALHRTARLGVAVVERLERNGLAVLGRHGSVERGTACPGSAMIGRIGKAHLGQQGIVRLGRRGAA